MILRAREVLKTLRSLIMEFYFNAKPRFEVLIEAACILSYLPVFLGLVKLPTAEIDARIYRVLGAVTGVSGLRV